MLISSAMASSSDRSTSAFARVALLAFVLGMVDHEGNGRRQSQGNCRCETEMALPARVAWLKSLRATDVGKVKAIAAVRQKWRCRRELRG